MSTTVAGSVTGVSLTLPEEPVALGAEIRAAVLGGADWSAVFGEDLGIGGPMWEAWGPVLEAAGMTHDTFSSIVVSYRRELWFWLLGDRIWVQTASGLAGRLLRRLPAS